MKAQGAIAMASIAKQTSSLVPPYLGMILSALVQGLAGRTWAGKVREHWLCIFVWGRNLIGYDFGLFLQSGFLASGKFFLIIYDILYQNMFHPICS